ncbi:MAG: hypothetical protein WD361_14950 [Gracilimonas sp.]
MNQKEQNKKIKQEILSQANAGELEEKETNIEPDPAVQESIDNRLKRKQNQSEES